MSHNARIDAYAALSGDSRWQLSIYTTIVWLAKATILCETWRRHSSGEETITTNQWRRYELCLTPWDETYITPELTNDRSGESEAKCRTEPDGASEEGSERKLLQPTPQRWQICSSCCQH